MALSAMMVECEQFIHLFIYLFKRSSSVVKVKVSTLTEGKFRRGTPLSESIKIILKFTVIQG